VSVGTVTAQLLYEIGAPHYLNPDVTSYFETIRLTADGPDRVAVSGVRGGPPPPDLKVALNYLGGYRNSMTFGLAGLAVERKAELLEKALWQVVGDRGQFDAVDVKLIGSHQPDPETNDEALSYLRVTVKDRDPDKVGRRFSRAAVELALSHYPGFFVTSPPGEATSYAVYWPTSIPAALVPMRVSLASQQWEVSSVAPDTGPAPPPAEGGDGGGDSRGPREVSISAGTARLPLGTIAGARSGDKGGNANVGFWVATPEAYRWLSSYLTVDRLHHLLPEAEELRIERYELPNLLALNFVVFGLLGEGVSSSTRTDPQAKSLGEFLRARLVEIPRSLLTEDG
ncbi:MAG TPA: acyclic terpene utilization AtuA family protein, partial [Acidimicrobiia bacterium]|nr:acyclic terpene utilization AtuA family protein [Acidimicrobiia bacterium]